MIAESRSPLMVIEHPEQPSAGYYGTPVIHRPHWKWLVTGYFFFGGISGSSAAIAAFARYMAGQRGEPLARTATYVAFATLAPCPGLLILDLGRPARFLNMLRVFRPSSPMSMGTWGLTGFGLLLTLATAWQIWEDLVDAGRQQTSPVAGRFRLLLAVACGGFGLFVAGYTGVLLSATAVPLWSKRPVLLGPLFLSSAMASGAAAVTAATAIWRPTEDSVEERLRQFEVIAATTEGSLLFAWIVSLGATGKPLNTGLLGYVVRHGVLGAGICGPLAISAAATRFPRRLRRAATITAAALSLVGVIALRFAVVEGGRASADDPAATFAMTR